MGRFVAFLIASSLSFTTHALRIEDALVGPSGLSPVRPKATSFQEMALHHEVFSQYTGHANASVYNVRQSYRNTDWTRVPEISEADLAKLFQNVRDKRILKDGKGRARRLTWLFPDNGCFARAELMNEEAGNLGLTKPGKIFVFGNLQVRTDFHPDGLVTWWYHVAPVVRVGNDVFVLDPSMDQYKPLPVAEWVRQMDSAVDVSICSSHSYDPDSLCDYKAGSQARRAIMDENFFMIEEWNRVLDLGRNPEYDLGDFPPWSNHQPIP
ncbi:MAG: hypothetical protein KF767_12600 [Bdellovibrionaceae bacterium]|nr:hypothetical protein [Pseudobdellovibrionaceae bacterium]